MQRQNFGKETKETKKTKETGKESKAAHTNFLPEGPRFSQGGRSSGNSSSTERRLSASSADRTLGIGGGGAFGAFAENIKRPPSSMSSALSDQPAPSNSYASRAGGRHSRTQSETDLPRFSKSSLSTSEFPPLSRKPSTSSAKEQFGKLSISETNPGLGQPPLERGAPAYRGIGRRQSDSYSEERTTSFDRRSVASRDSGSFYSRFSGLETIGEKIVEIDTSLKDLHETIKSIEKYSKDKEGCSVYQYLTTHNPPEKVLTSIGEAFSEGRMKRKTFTTKEDVFSALESEKIDKLREVRNSLFKKALEYSPETEYARHIHMYCKVISDAIDRKYLNLIESYKMKKEGTLSSGVCYSRAVIEINGKPVQETRYKTSGGKSGFPYEFPSNPKMKHALRLSAGDAEAQTLYDLELALDALRPSATSLKDATITMTIYGDQGSCDPCDYRVREFINASKKLDLPYKDLAVRSCYASEPHEVLKEPTGFEPFTTMYGRGEKVETLITSSQNSTVNTLYVESTSYAENYSNPAFIPNPVPFGKRNKYAGKEVDW